MRTCFLFPGQGAQKSGMGRDLWERSPAVKDLFQLASDIAGINAERLLFSGTEEELKTTHNTQFAMTLVNVAAAQVLTECGVTADMVAGFSVGEYAALHYAGVLSTADLFAVVHARGQLMAEASGGISAETGMAAVLGDLDRDPAQLVGEAGEGVFLAIQSTKRQITIAGTAAGLGRAEPIFKEAGARRYVRLRVSGPFHTPLISTARVRLAATLQNVEFQRPRLPVYANVTAKPIEGGAVAKELCLAQIVSTVRWRDEADKLIADGCQRFLEVGSGTVLSGMFRDFTSPNGCQPAGTVQQITKIASVNVSM